MSTPIQAPVKGDEPIPWSIHMLAWQAYRDRFQTGYRSHGFPMKTPEEIADMGGFEDVYLDSARDLCAKAAP